MRFAKVIVASLVIPMLILSAWAITAPREAVEPLSGSIMAEPYFSGVEKTWDAAGDAAASSPASWDPVGALSAGDNVTFDGTSVTNCAWDVEITLGNFSMLTGYTGTVTQSVDFGVASYHQESGTYTGSVSYWMTDEGNWSLTGGTLTGALLNLEMTGDDSVFSWRSADSINTLEVSANITVTGNNGVVNIYDYNGVVINVGKTLTIDNGITWRRSCHTGNLWANDGIVTGPGTLQFFFYSLDRTITFGTINAPTQIYLVGSAAASHICTADTSTVFGSTLNVYSDHASNTMTLDLNDYTLGVTGVTTLGNRGIMTQGTGAWSFGSYAQTGVSSVFNQGATVTIGGDFTVSAGVFNAVGDMTVPGDWDTATGDYVNDDNVVTLTGDTKTLDMAATDSFFNVTIAAGANYTMDDDTTVDRRATITGILYGAGDFKEPLPEFTSEGWPHACPLTLYEYTPTQTYWDTLDLVDPPYWLHLIDGVVTGVPNDNDTGLYEITLTLTWNDMVTYQNYTLIVCPELLSGADKTMLGVVLSIVLGFGLLAIGMTYKIPPLIVFSGLIWLISAVTVYKDISVEWAIIGIGLGVIVLASGGLQLVDEG